MKGILYYHVPTIKVDARSSNLHQVTIVKFEEKIELKNKRIGINIHDACIVYYYYY